MPEIEWWRKQGYIAGKELPGGMWLILVTQLFTTRLAISTPQAMYEFWCYEEPLLAVLAFEAWEPGDLETRVEGWTRHHVP